MITNEQLNKLSELKSKLPCEKSSETWKKIVCDEELDLYGIATDENDLVLLDGAEEDVDFVVAIYNIFDKFIEEIQRLRAMYEGKLPPERAEQFGNQPIAVSAPGAILMAENDKLLAECKSLRDENNRLKIAQREYVIEWFDTNKDHVVKTMGDLNGQLENDLKAAQAEADDLRTKLNAAEGERSAWEKVAADRLTPELSVIAQQRDKAYNCIDELEREHSKSQDREKKLLKALQDAIWAADYLSEQQAMQDDGYVERLENAKSVATEMEKKQ